MSLHGLTQSTRRSAPQNDITLKPKENPMSESMNEYVRKLRTALSEGTYFTAYNRDTAHARAVLSLAFEFAEEKILLLSNRLDHVLYAHPTFVGALKKFLDDGGVLDVLTETEIDPRHPFLTLTKEYSDRVSCNVVPSSLQSLYKFNFMVMDDTGYRFERDRDEHKAVVVMNAQTDAERRFIEQSKTIFNYLKPVAETD